MIVTWRSDFEIGILEIDGQHREIFARFDQLLQAIEDGKGREEVERTLKFLGEYSHYHFAKEEALQQSYGYPHYEMHSREHHHFISTLDSIFRTYVAIGAQDEVVKKTSQALNRWLIEHICNTDRAFAAFLVNRPLIE